MPGLKEKKEEETKELSPEERALYWKSTATSLQMQLAERTDLMKEARDERRALEEKVNKIKAEFEEEQRTAMEITRDMTRQYKGMQEQLVDRITELSNTVQELQDRLDIAERENAHTLREKDAIIANKEDEINEIKAKMEDMATEFGGMLKETLDKMRLRIEVSANNIDMEQRSPLLPS